MQKPYRTTIPRLFANPRLPAAAIGPGVGGINVWEAYSPVERATAMAVTLVWAFLVTDFLMALSIIKPESQNTGMETSQPIRLMANSGFLGPTSLITVLAIFKAAPDFSRNTPMIEPRTITIPIWERIDPNPCRITGSIS